LHAAYTYPNIKEFFIDSDELPDSKQILITVWEPPKTYTKGDSSSIPFTFLKVKGKNDKFILPYTLEYSYSGGVIKLKISREN
jgi:hypothetical protein